MRAKKSGSGSVHHMLRGAQGARTEDDPPKEHESHFFWSYPLTAYPGDAVIRGIWFMTDDGLT